MAEEFVIKVTPDVLENKACEIQKEIMEIETQWSAMQRMMENSKYYWEGEAGELYRNYLIEVQEVMEEILRHLKEHPSDLLRMAGIYAQTEKNITALTSVLSSDVII